MARLVLHIEPDADGICRARLPADGTYVFADQGDLDIGVLRVGADGNFHEAPYDPSEWRIFHETFENVAFIGSESIEVLAKPER